MRQPFKVRKHPKPTSTARWQCVDTRTGDVIASVYRKSNAQNIAIMANSLEGPRVVVNKPLTPRPDRCPRCKEPIPNLVNGRRCRCDDPRGYQVDPDEDRPSPQGRYGQ